MTDTSTAEVERLIAELTRLAPFIDYGNRAAVPPTVSSDFAAFVRALAAERDALRSQLTAMAAAVSPGFVRADPVQPVALKLDDRKPL